MSEKGEKQGVQVCGQEQTAVVCGVIQEGWATRVILSNVVLRATMWIYGLEVVQL